MIFKLPVVLMDFEVVLGLAVLAEENHLETEALFFYGYNVAKAELLDRQ